MSLPPSLFGTHVGRRPRLATFLGEVLFTNRQAKVSQVGMLSAFLDQDVCWLDVTVDQPFVVCVLKCFGNRGDQRCRFSVSRPGFFDALSEVATFDELRHDIHRAVVRTSHVMHRHDVRVIEAGECLGFTQVRLGVLRTSQSLRSRHLDRHVSLEFFVLAQPNPSKRPFPQNPQQPISADPLVIHRQLRMECESGIHRWIAC